MRYEFIDKEKANHPVKLLCRMMRVGASAYYRYARGATYRETTAQKICREKVRVCFYEHRRRRKLETLNESKVLFPLGNVYLTIGAREALEESNQTANAFLSRHQCGDYGDICEDDKRENELSVKEGFRILSSYKTSQGVKIWVITEADRSSTTLLLPNEY
ncbi:MAG: hypothetical protein WKF71_16480 [Pyrinomonadaceae bacterium]